MASVIARSEGPSGKNSEYLFMLEEALKELGTGAGDEHVEDLAGRVRGLLGGSGDDEGGVEREVERVRSGEGKGAVEETEKVA